MIFDKEKFSSLCEELSANATEGDSIGTYNEKRLHRIIKRLISQNESDYEYKIGRHVADVFDGKTITEIQTGGFYPLRKKIDYYLSNTEYFVRVIKPVVAEKRIVRVDKESGEVIRCRRSPLRARLGKRLLDFSYLGECFLSSRFEVVLLYVSADEHRYTDKPVRYRRSGRYDSELYPTELLDIEVWRGREAFAHLLEDMPDLFYSKDFSARHSLSGRELYSALKLLCELGLITRGEKSAKGYEYRISK